MRFLHRYWPSFLPRSLLRPLLLLAALTFLIALTAALNIGTLALRGGLVWNMFLAGTPLLFALFILVAQQLRWKKIFTLPLWLLWLFLFPNAPYMITDWLYVPWLELTWDDTAAGKWFGLLHLSAGIVVGLCFGLLSLLLLHRHVAKRYGRATGWVFAGTACFLSGVGIWIGRCMRFNTWDIWQNPLHLLRMVFGQLDWDAAKLCLVFAVMTAGAYLLLHVFLPLDMRTETDA